LEESIGKIIEFFKEAKIWNDGKFYKAVKDYCKQENLDFKLISSKLEIAFRDVLATNITSENAIRFRLKNEPLKNIAL
jgi:hypothetical protein